MGIKVDFSGVEAGGGFKPLVAGAYSGTIFDIEQKKGQESGKPYLAMTLKLNADEDRGVIAGRQAWSNFSLQPNALWKLKQLLVRLGFEEDALDGITDLDVTELLGLDVTVVLEAPEERRTTNNVRDIFGPEHVVAGESTF